MDFQYGPVPATGCDGQADDFAMLPSLGTDLFVVDQVAIKIENPQVRDQRLAGRIAYQNRELGTIRQAGNVVRLNRDEFHPGQVEHFDVIEPDFPREVIEDWLISGSVVSHKLIRLQLL